MNLLKIRARVSRVCVCVCVLCACIYIVLLYTFCSLVYFEEKFRNGNERKINQTPHKNSTTSARDKQMPQIQYSEKYYDDVYEYRYALILLRENVRSELGLHGRIYPENAES